MKDKFKRGKRNMRTNDIILLMNFIVFVKRSFSYL